MHLVALQCVLVITGFLGGGGQAITVTIDRDAASTPEEYIEVTEGDTLNLNCAVSNYYWQQGVYWGKSGPPSVWLTVDSDVYVTSDSRVSVNTFWDVYYTYSMQISDITTEDSGKYICYVTWNGFYTDREGYVYVLVRNFPKKQPVCSPNQTANSTSDSVFLWCDTVKGYPGVNVTWTVDGPGDDEIPNTSAVDYDDSDGTGRKRVWMELRLNSTDWGNPRTKEFVCTVTSSGFPGLERTCSVNVTLERHVTTEAYIDGNVHSTGTGSLESSSLGDDTNDETTSESVPDPKGSDDKQIAGSSAVGSTVAIALVIPALFIALLTLLICVLKRKRQRKNRQGRKTKRATSPIGPNKDRGGEVVVPYSVTQLQNDKDADISNSANNPGTISGEETNVSPRAGQFDLTCQPYSVTTQQKQTVDSGVDFSNSSYESCQPAGDVADRVSPYEVELDLNGESAVYSQIPNEFTTRDINGQRSSSDYETVQSAHPGERQEENIGYEALNRDRTGNSSSATKIQANLSRKSSGRLPQTMTPTDEFEGVDDRFMEDESDEGTILNPIYEPFGNGQGGARVEAEPQADGQNIYQMIN